MRKGRTGRHDPGARLELLVEADVASDQLSRDEQRRPPRVRRLSEGRSHGDGTRAFPAQRTSRRCACWLRDGAACWNDDGGGRRVWVVDWCFVKTLLVVLAAVAMMACDESPTNPSDLVGDVWRLASIDTAGTGPVIVPDPDRYTIQFLESGRLSVRADCNTCGGSYALTGTALSLGALACTRAFCGNTSLDGMFTQALGQTRSAARRGAELHLAGDGRVLRFSQ
jgi:heat shock protein HslJ